MGRCCLLTKILTLPSFCLAVYFYLYNEASEEFNNSAKYCALCGDHKNTWNKSLDPISYFSNETGTVWVNDSSVKKLKTLSLEAILSLIGVNFQNVSVPWANRVKEILKLRTRPLLTLFTSWPESIEKYNLHNITSLNWLSLVPTIVPVVFTNEHSLAVECSRKGWIVYPVIATAAQDAPVLKYMYLDAMKKFDSEFYAFANSDILFTDSLVETLISILESDSVFKGHTLIIGRRTNVNNLTMSEGSSWIGLVSASKERGNLFDVYAEDYFITSASYPWMDIPDIVIGRRAYDNWLVLNARRMKHRVIDATETILAVHQTTEAGNFEGLKHPDTGYNHNLLEKLYKTLPYPAGYTNCAEFFTRKDNMKMIISRRLKLAQYCNLW